MSLEANLTNMKNSMTVALLNLEPKIIETANAGLEFSARETLAWIEKDGIRYRVSVLVESTEVAEAYND